MSFRNIWPMSALPLILLACHGARAADNTSELDYYQDFPVVLSASRLYQPQSEAPNAMTVIDRKMIVASGFRTIPDLFKLVPGMYVSYYKGSQAFVSYHGATDQYARRMQVMIDGRSVYLPPVSMVSWANLPITVDDIERIEVIRGPSAASHGANSTQGVISIITRDAGAATGRRVSVTRGSKGINDVSARFGSAGEKFDYRMTLAYTADNGYDDLTTNPNNISGGVSLLNNSHDSNQARLLNYRADYHPNSADRFDLQFGFNHDVQGVGFNDRNPSPIFPTLTNANTLHDLFSNSGFLQLGWIRLLENNAELNVRYSHLRQDQHESLSYFESGTFVPGPILQYLKTARDEVEAQHTLPLSVSNRLVYGAAYRADHINAQGSIPLAPPVYASSFNTNEYRVFAHDEWRITPQLLLNTGAMFERNGMGHERTSPRVALNFHFTPRHTLRMGTSVAYRTPSLVEERYPIDRYLALRALYPARASAMRLLYLPGALFVSSKSVTSPNLRPEKMVSQEIGYLGEFPDWATSLDLRVFRDQLNDGIYIASTNVFTNGMSAVYNGLETTLKHSFDKGGELTVNFAHELASSNGPALLASGQRTFRPARPEIADILSGSTPRNSASLLYSQRVADTFSFSTAYYYQDSMQPFDRGFLDYQPIQRRVDVRIAKEFRDTGSIKGEVALVVQNLFDQGYTEYIANNLFNRRGYVTLTVNW
ncbi:MAG: TonB-dependent receptor [Nitrosomonadales bacterium]|nr:TonB-dependent receptor [Nitrosomonadales bacterium]